ncbi:digeranylgeranylglyceryl phosphate synthase [Methanosarcinales archaeon]|nr:MAG: digeranylgeranylglyceryl phosphate synthase [Methanosarcinales archaeon]
MGGLTTRAWLELFRIKNCIMASLAVAIGLVVSRELWSEVEILALLSVFMITGAGNALNDVYDIEIDRVNKPDRPLPSGRLEKSVVMRAVSILFIVGILLSLVVSLEIDFFFPFALALINSVLLWSYGVVLKRLPLIGNILISYLTASTFLYGGSLTGEVMGVVIVLFILSFFATLSREVVKSIEDVEGDKIGGANTIAVVWGTSKSSTFAVLCILITIALSPLPYLAGFLKESYLMLVVVADAGFLYALTQIHKNPTTASTILKPSMGIALVAFLSGAIFGL